MSLTQSIALTNGGCFPQYLLVHVVPSDGPSRDIREIEIFSRPDHCPESLISDGIVFSELPLDTQLRILSALDEKQDSTARIRRGFRRLWADIQADAAAARLMACADYERSLPGHARPRDWFEDAVRRGCTDIGAV
jgi:hypothetical protein